MRAHLETAQVVREHRDSQGVESRLAVLRQFGVALRLRNLAEYEDGPVRHVDSDRIGATLSAGPIGVDDLVECVREGGCVAVAGLRGGRAVDTLCLHGSLRSSRGGL